MTIALNAMIPAKACDIIDFFDALPWPLTKTEVNQAAVDRFGWETEREGNVDYLVNSKSGFKKRDVSVTGSGDQVYSISFHVTDSATEANSESEAELGDRFALLTAEAVARWGKPRLSRSEDVDLATWDLPGGGSCTARKLTRSLTFSFSTPQALASDQAARRR